jgi:thiamine kinase-like enzyme
MSKNLYKNERKIFTPLTKDTCINQKGVKTMKKLMPLALAFSVLTGGVVTVSAAQAENVQTVKEKKGYRHFRHMKNFEAQVHKANALKVEQLEIQKQIVQQKDKLFDIHVKAAENGKQEKRDEKKVNWQSMKKIHQELRALHKEAHETKKSMHEAMKADNEKLALEKMNQWLSINEKINSKLVEKSAKLDEILAQYK